MNDDLSKPNPEERLRAQTVPGGMTDVDRGSAGGDLSTTDFENRENAGGDRMIDPASQVAPTGTSGASGPTFHSSQDEQTGTADLSELEIERGDR